MHNKEVPYDIYGVFTVQEEVGLRGAQMITENIKPDLAIVTDVSHDTQSPHYNRNIFGSNHMIGIANIGARNGLVLVRQRSVTLLLSLKQLTEMHH